MYNSNFVIKREQGLLKVPYNQIFATIKWYKMHKKINVFLMIEYY